MKELTIRIIGTHSMGMCLIATYTQQRQVCCFSLWQRIQWTCVCVCVYICEVISWFCNTYGHTVLFAVASKDSSVSSSSNLLQLRVKSFKITCNTDDLIINYSIKICIHPSYSYIWHDFNIVCNIPYIRGVLRKKFGPGHPEWLRRPLDRPG